MAHDVFISDSSTDNTVADAANTSGEQCFPALPTGRAYPRSGVVAALAIGLTGALLARAFLLPGPSAAKADSPATVGSPAATSLPAPGGPPPSSPPQPLTPTLR